MAKKRKTRQQKIISDLRHQNLSPRATQSPQISLTQINKFTPAATKQQISSGKTLPLNEYAFVRHDLKRTSFITGAIVLAELVLFFVVAQ